MMRILTYVSYLVHVLIFVSCAVVGPSPPGGPEDKTPPVLINQTPPNKAVNQKPTKITLYYDEYVLIDLVAKDFVITPSIPIMPPIISLGKRVQLDLSKVELRPNTTYSITTGSIIKDNNNNNVAPSQKIVFSTGPVIDSLKISGTITDSYRQTLPDNIIFSLYNSVDLDSTILRDKPLYYTQSIGGSFKLDYISPGSYKLFALEDKNQNLTLDVGESVSFIDGNIFLNKDTVFTTAIRLFPYQGEGLSISNIIVNPNLTVIKTSAPIDSIWTSNPNRVLYKDYNESKDSVSLFTNNKTAFGLIDTFHIYTIAGNKRIQIDTIITQKPDDKFVLPKTSIRINISKENLRRYGYFLSLKSNVPIRKVDASMLRFTGNNLPISVKDMVIPKDSERFEYFINVSGNDRLAYRLIVLPGAVVDVFGVANKDTLVAGFSAFNDKTFGSLNGYLISSKKSKSRTKYFELINDKGVVIAKSSFKDSTNFDIKYLDAGTYFIRVVADVNENGRWDGGNLWLRRRPEEVIYSNPLVVKTGWLIKDIRLELPF
ncbi:MAG: Ig-like domain-containing protein [Bacteroidota bacterium]|nr:Ig-like domain-containing protein [Bacteroidota bacterium]